MCRTRTWEKKSTLTSPILLTSDQLNDCVAS